MSAKTNGANIACKYFESCQTISSSSLIEIRSACFVRLIPIFNLHTGARRSAKCTARAKTNATLAIRRTQSSALNRSARFRSGQKRRSLVAFAEFSNDLHRSFSSQFFHYNLFYRDFSRQPFIAAFSIALSPSTL